MKSIFFDLNIPKILLTQILSTVWKGAFYSGVSPVSYSEIPEIELPGKKWVRVKNQLSGICGSDLSLFFLDANPKISLAALPGLTRVFLGHEMCGEVIEAGSGVKRMKIGDRVVFQKTLPSCFHKEIEPKCIHCRDGNYALCENQSEGTLPKNTGGGWSDSFLAHESVIQSVPDSLSDDEAVLVEPAAVAVRAVLRKMPAPGDHVLIVGAGIIGLLTLQVVKILQPESKVTILARHPFQIKLAKKFGADFILDGKNSYEKIADITGAKYYSGMFKNKMLLGGFDKIFDCVGKGRTIHDSLRWCKAGGVIVLVGVDYNPSKFDYTPIVFQEIEIIGTFCHGMENFSGENISTFDLTMRLLQQKKLNVDELITHRFKLDDYQKALKIVTDKKSSSVIKAVFEFK